MTSDEKYNREELWMAIFGIKLSRLIKERNVTIQDLSKETGIRWSTIKGYTKGTHSPKAFNVYLLAKALKSSFDELMHV